LCNSCESLAGLVLCFITCFILLVIAPLVGRTESVHDRSAELMWHGLMHAHNAPTELPSTFACYQYDLKRTLSCAIYLSTILYTPRALSVSADTDHIMRLCHGNTLAHPQRVASCKTPFTGVVGINYIPVRDGNGSVGQMGHNFGWVTWVMGHCQ